MYRVGVSEIVSAAMFIAILIAAIGIVLNVALPQIDQMEDTSAIENSISFLTQLDGLIQEVAAEGRYSSRQANVQFRRGEYGFDNASGAFFYELETQAPLISTHATSTIGPVRLSADRDVSVTNSSVDGTPCYLMKNDRLEACIRKIPKTFSADLYPSLIGYWRMDEGSGQYVNDSSIYGNDGRRGDSAASEGSDPSWVNGIHRQGLDFDGNDDYVFAGNDSSLLAESFTLSSWINLEEYRAKNGIAMKGSPGQSEEITYMLGSADGNGFVAFEASDGSDHVVIANTTFALNTWYHLVGTFDAGTNEMRLYIDGQLDEENTSVGRLPAQHNGYLGIGNGIQDDGSPHNNWFFNGTIDDVRVYNRSLSAEEVEWMYLQQGDEHYVNTSRMLASLRNVENGTTLNGMLHTTINNSDATAEGIGHTTANLGRSLGRGRVVLNVSNSGEGQYNVTYELLSGADFLTVRSDAANVTTGLTFVLDSLAADAVYIDDVQRGAGTYTSDDIGFGYGVGEGAGLMSGVVAGSGFHSVTYDDTVGNGQYDISVTTPGDSAFLVPYTRGTHDAVENRERFIRNGVFGSNRFFGFPSPNFGFALTDQKTVRTGLQYDNILLDGPSQTLAPGSYQLIVTNNGLTDGKTNVTIRIK